MSSAPLASIVRYEPGAVMEPHAHEVAGVGVVLGGSIREQVNCREECGNVGSVVFKPAGLIHRNHVGPAGALILALKGADAEQMAAYGWRWTFGGKAAAIGLAVARSVRWNDLGEAEDATLRLLELLSGRPERSPPPAGAWLRAVRDRIEDESPTPAVAELAKTAGVHPASLARAFRLRFGCSVSQYSKRLRVRRAADLLLTTDFTVSQVAASVDSYDQSHLCRDFRSELGLSPSLYRSTMAC